MNTYYVQFLKRQPAANRRTQAPYYRFRTCKNRIVAATPAQAIAKIATRIEKAGEKIERVLGIWLFIPTAPRAAKSWQRVDPEAQS